MPARLTPRLLTRFAPTIKYATPHTTNPVSSPKLTLLPQVAAIEPDMVWTLDAVTTQSPSTWGLGAISHRTPNHTTYLYNAGGGAGTFAYVVDSGIRATHAEFEGRASLGYIA